MDGILVINKPKGITSRDVVNKVCKILNTKKVGHTGTLDPIATGVLVLCVGKATKMVEILTSNDKEYIATVKLGILTDSLDTDGNIIKEEKVLLDKDKLIKVLNSFVGSYEQEVPIYSAVKINGRKLYEYARENTIVELPKRMVNIYDIELLELTYTYYKFRVKVSKGTYIRSLIKDINDELGIIGSMSDLIRTKQGIFNIENSYLIENIENNEYNMLSIEDTVDKNNNVIINDNFYSIIKNGSIIENKYNKEYVNFIYNDKLVAIYKIYEKDNKKMKPFKMFV